MLERLMCHKGGLYSPFVDLCRILYDESLKFHHVIIIQSKAARYSNFPNDF